MAHWFTRRTTGQHAEPKAPAVTGIAAVDHRQLLRLMESVTGAFYLPGDAGYPLASRQEDPSFLRAPIAVVMCRDEADIIACLRWCNELGVSATFRSGGHSTAGYSVLDRTLTVDVSQLDEIRVDPAARTATVGPGVNFGRLNVELDRHRLHVPGGGCGTVCLAGYMQGGGYGFTSRSFGMNCDNVREIRFLTRDAEPKTASATENPELFWAFRGGTGGNFGVVTRITYDLQPLAEIWGFGLTWELDKAPEAMRLMEEGFMQGGPDFIGYMTFIIARQDPTTGEYRTALFMRGMCVSGREAGLAALAPLEASGGSYDYDRTGSYGFLNGDLLADLEPRDLGAIFELKASNYISKQLGAADWQTVVDIFRKSPSFPAGHANTLTLEPYGGRIAERSARTDNAFIHRTVQMNFAIDSFYGTADQKPAAEAWLGLYKDFLRGSEGRSNGQVYQNYPEADLDDWQDAYFAEAFPRLLKIKQQVDPPTPERPDGFFAFPQSLRPKP